MIYQYDTPGNGGSAGARPATPGTSRTAVVETSKRPTEPRRVGDCMSKPVMVVHKQTPVLDAYNQMIQAGVRRLPVVDGTRLVGIVTMGDLREARPSPATSLSIYELNYLLSRLTVDRVMTHTPVTATESMSLKEAAALMLTHKIGGLPVVDAQGQPIGIITESDFFRLFTTFWDAQAGVPDPATS